MINIFSRKILIVHFIIILLFFSCKNNQSNISISSPKDCFADSVVLGNSSITTTVLQGSVSVGSGALILGTTGTSTGNIAFNGRKLVG